MGRAVLVDRPPPPTKWGYYYFFIWFSLFYYLRVLGFLAQDTFPRFLFAPKRGLSLGKEKKKVSVLDRFSAYWLRSSVVRFLFSALDQASFLIFICLY